MRIYRYLLNSLKSTERGRQLVWKIITLKLVLQVWKRRSERFFAMKAPGSQTTRHFDHSIYRLSANGFPTFFGYYDKTPFSLDGTKILAMAMATSKDWSSNAAKHPVRLGYFELRDDAKQERTYRQFGTTEAWSWQQGCMLQWFPENPDKLVIYNRVKDGRYESVVQDVISHKILKRIEMPIYAIDSSAKFAISLNFSRLERLRRGYGYNNLPDHTADVNCPEDDGLWLINLESGVKNLLISIYELARLKSDPSMVDSQHYVNHIQFSPNGKLFVFLHLWMPLNSPRKNRLILYDLENRTARILDDAALVSHFNWLSDTEIICFRSPFSGKQGYYTLEVDAIDTLRFRPLMKHKLSEDGHPSLSPTGNWMVTDTYPDEYGDQNLYLYSFKSKNLFQAGKFRSPSRYRGFMRCDLHPRWDHKGKLLCFDSTDGGRRSMYVLDTNILDQTQVC